MKIREWWLRILASSSARELADYIDAHSSGARLGYQKFVLPNGLDIYMSNTSNTVNVMNEWYSGPSAKLIRYVIRKAVINGKIKSFS